MKTPQHTTHSSRPQSSFARIALQIFVWILIIAFVSTLGVMWDGTSTGFPVVVDSSKGSIDLSPRSLYFVEYNRLDEQLRANNSNADPRLFNRFVQSSTLTNVTDALLRQIFYQNINLKPSRSTFQSLQANTGLSSNLIDFQYSDNYFNGPLGVVPVLSTPSISDLYAFSDLQKLSIALELIVFNKTNFLYSKIQTNDLETYYENTFEQWIDNITFDEFTVNNRREARTLISSLQTEGLSNTISNLSTNITYQSNVVLVANFSNFNYFNNIITSYKSNTSEIPVIVGPIYNQGEYSVAVINVAPSFTNLSDTVKRDITLSYLNKNFNALSKEFDKEWKTQVKSFQESMTNDSFSTIAADIQGVVNYNTLPFTLTQSTITNVFNQPLNLPLLNNRETLDSILNTPLSEVSAVLNPNKDIYIALRPIYREYNTETTNNYNDPNLLQGTYQYKATTFINSLSSESLKNKYKVSVHPNELTNLN